MTWTSQLSVNDAAQLDFLSPVAFPRAQRAVELSPEQQRKQIIHEQANSVIRHMFAVERPIGVGEVFPFLAEHGGIPDNTDPIVHWSRVRTHIAKRYGPDIIATSGKVAPRNMHSGFGS